MEYNITLQGSITLDTGIAISGQIAGMSFNEGDAVNLYIDSEGGYIESAFVIARCIEGLQEAGILCRGIAIGKVWSAALIPYLSCYERVCAPDANFLIHPVTIDVDGLGTATANDLGQMESDIWNITYSIEDHYRKNGVKEEVTKFLYGEKELTCDSPVIAKGYGLVTDMNVVEAPSGVQLSNLTNWFKGKGKNVKPIYRLSKNYKHLNDFEMATLDEKIENMRNELGAEMDKKLNEMSEALNEIRKSVCGSKKNEEDAKNEAEEMTEEEVKSMAPHFRKTPVTVEGAEEIKWLAHPGKDIEKDHFVIPIDKDGKAKMLPEGDYTVKEDDEDFLLHSTGTTAYIHGRGAEGKKNESEEEEEEKNEDKPELPKDKKNETEEVKETKFVTKAPLNKGTSGTKVSKAEKYWKEAMQYFGPGSVGITKK